MPVKTRVASHLSARFKFKDADNIEVVIIDSDTNDIYYIRWAFRKDALPVVEKGESDHD